MPSFTNTHTDNHMFAILHMRHLLWNQRRSYGTSQSTRESRFAAIAQIKWDDSSWHKFQARSCKRCGKSKTSRRQILRRKWSKENTRGSVKCDEWRCFLSASARPPTSGCDRAWQFLMHLGEVHMYLHWRPHKSCLKENKYKNVMFKNWKVILNYIQCLKRKSQKYCVSVKLCHCCTLSNTDKDSSGHNKECNCYRL